MNRAVILHGTDGSPQENWFSWLKTQLEARGYEVFVPELPSNHTPSRKVYNEFLINSGWDFTDNLIVGHSSGAVSVLNLLGEARVPKIKTGVLVGAWAHMEETDLDKDQFKDLFPESGFNFPLIKSKADKLLFVHGDNDPYCPIEQAKWLAEQTESEIVIIPKGQHFSASIDPTLTKFPKLIEILEARQLL